MSFTHFFVQYQKYCDIAMRIGYPAPGQVINYGDTVTARVYIVNLGPDTLFASSDTVFYKSSTSPAMHLQMPDLLPGDSALYDVFSFVDLESNTISDSFCVYYLPFASTYIDTNTTNDTSCVAFTLSGGNTSIGHVEDNNELKIFPNPASGRIFIQVKNGSFRQGDIQIMDMLGRVRENYENVPLRNGAFEINISKLQPGFYVIRLGTGSQHYYQKIVVQ